MRLNAGFASLCSALFHFRLVSSYSFFFNNTDFEGQTQNLSSKCATAMQAPLSCDTSLLQIMMGNFYGMLGNETVQDIFCNATCGNDLTKYQEDVASACQRDPQPLPGYPATYWGDVALSAWTTTCLKDSATGKYCAEILTEIFNGSTTDNDGTGLSEEQLCSNCVVSLFRQMQGTSYSNYDQTLADVWKSIQGTCSLDYPIDVQPLKTNVTTPGGYAQPGSGSAGCLSGKTYEVVSGDNCETIARNANISTGTLMAINSIYQDCSNLLVGRTLCLPESCTSYVVQSGDTCDSIGQSTSSDFQRLVAWNPAINPYCSNLIAGQNICVGPPGGAATYTTIAGATATQTAAYATATATRPDPVGSGTTRNCGKYYQVQLGDYCQLVALNQTISLDLFLAINPSINSTCGNLETGVWYCVWPTVNWNSTGTSTIATPPTATPTGTTPNCYEYYVIQSGDNCGKLENQFAITFGQLQYWNPDINADCSNLLLDDAYCVNGVTQPPSGDMPITQTAAAVEARRTASPTREGGVPYGWPGLDGRSYWKGGLGAALMEPGL